MASELVVEKGKASVEHYEVAANDGRPAVMGTMHLNTEELLLVPAPSSDPRDPLNLPRWRKILFVVLLSACEL
ncbi:hypothetical protein LTR17_000974 [Elasticomyces elasticus]|nr:hypothetical protein LTR17_000974 [Elasticomyces elasticus]